MSTLYELVSTAALYSNRLNQKHPTLFGVGGVVLGLAVLRSIWLIVWWLFFAPARLYPLTGTLSCDSVPIEEGNVSLEPVAAPGVASRTAHIVGGVFALDAKNGVRRDVEYLVRIEGFRKTGKTFPGVKPGEFSEEYEQFVLPQHNRASGLRVQITRACIREGLTINVHGSPPRKPDASR